MTHRFPSIALRVLVLTAVVFAASAPAALAQDGTKTPVPHNQTISANPFGLMLKWFNVEYERKLTNTMTLGASGSNFGLGDADLQRFNALFRYYPQGAALTGVYLGGRGGVARVSDAGDDAHAFAMGVEIGYSWLFGSKRNVGISIGAGVDRLFGGDLDNFDIVWPNVRLVNVGIAF
jgi:opacity protein-like surface antigen